MRGIVLAGGKGTRLGALTKVTNKHLLPVGPLPMIYYPIKKLIGAEITEILLVSGTEHMGDFVELLGSGSELGCEITYKVQDEAGGIAQALSLARNFGRGDSVLVVLGDNIFYESLHNIASAPQIFSEPHSAWVAIRRVEDPHRFGVAEIGLDNEINHVEEKPHHPKSNYIVTGIYLYPEDVYDIIRTLKPSSRGELEITDVNNRYAEQHRLKYIVLEDYWTDAGTLDSISKASELVREREPQY